MSDETYVRTMPQKVSIQEIQTARQLTATNWLLNLPDGELAVNAKYDPNKKMWWCFLKDKQSIATWNT